MPTFSSRAMYQNVSDKIGMKKFRKVKKWEENQKSQPDSEKKV